MTEPHSSLKTDIVAITIVGVAITAVSVGIVLWSLRSSPAVAPAAAPSSTMRDTAMAIAKAPTPPSADGITMAEGFVAERVASVPKELGSIASMCAMPDGSLMLGPQQGKLIRLDPASGTLTQLDLPIGDAQGMVYANDALYVVVNGGAAQGQGLYRVTDGNKDGTLDAVQLLRAIPGDTGEHGAHGIAVGPDGQLYITIGNHAKPPNPERSLVPRLWQEDFLLPRMWDANGHAVGIMAPGGFIVRTDLEGKTWEIFAIGFRNAYDIAFAPDGELFTYDSDMEWDIGAPWYRPTAVCHVVPGAEFGWRSGSACPPTWYVDLLPPAMPIGPGSPTGMVFGTGSKFPAPWRDALFCLDWTYATIHAVFLEPKGATYAARREQFLAGKGLPLTDAVILPKDGAMYVSTGGRGSASSVYRIRAVEESSGSAKESAPTRERQLRRELEKGQIDSASDGQIDQALVALSSDDRFVRYAARSVLEHQKLDRWSTRSLPGATAQGTVEHCLALVRSGGAIERDRAIATLLALDWGHLTPDEKRGALRTIIIALARHGKPDGAVADELRRRLDPLFPSMDQRSDRLLVELLVFLESPSVIAKALQVMESTDTAPDALDTALLSRNDNYGSVILKMAADNPRQQQIAMATALRSATRGWTPSYRERYFRWFPAAKRASGGHSFSGFLDHIREDALTTVPEGERERWTRIARGNEPTEAERPHPEGPGHRWTTAEIERVAAGVKSGRDFARGERMFKAANCIDCHRFAGTGRAGGPDLTGVGQRFGPHEMAEAIAEPSKVISDQYRFEEFTMKDGTTRLGRVVGPSQEKLTIIENLLAPDVLGEIEVANIASRRPSPISPMLLGLADGLSEGELADLLAYLKSGGDSRDAVFAKETPR